MNLLAETIKDLYQVDEDLSSLESISTDTRTINSKQIFLALRGQNFDGHDYLNQALARGAINVISETQGIQVENSLEAYQKIANLYRKKINPFVIAITGSSGKTTTKELLRCVLAEKYKLHYTEANFNNEIGVPKTILSMPEDTEILILEMGMRGLGEISLLSEIAEPNYALITNIGHAHIERLGSVENIQKAKMEIIDHLKSSESLPATLLVDTKLYEKIKGQKLNLDKLKSFDYEMRHSVEGLLSEGLIADINAVVEIARDLGLSDEQIKSGLGKYKSGKGRGEFLEAGGNLLIDETYNSNPEALKSSINALLKQFSQRKKVAVLGDIEESDSALVDSLFEELKALEDDKFTIFDFRNHDFELGKRKLEDADIKDSVILFKASRAAAFERFLTVYGDVCHDQ